MLSAETRFTAPLQDDRSACSRVADAVHSATPGRRPRLDAGIRVAGATALAIGAFYLGAWMVGAAARWGATAITVKTNMALALALAGAALLVSTWTVTPRREAARIVASALVLAIGLLTLCEHLFGVDLRIDQLLASEPPGALGTISPNRIGLPGSVSLTLLGTGLLAMRWRWRPSAYLGLATLLIVMVPAIGYLYRIGSFYSDARLTGIAWPTVVALSALALGLMQWIPPDGRTPLLWRDDHGGALLRRVWPAAVLAPLALGYVWLLGDRYGLYERTLGTGLFAIALIVFFSGLLWLSAAKLSASAQRHRQTDAELRQANDRLREADRRKDEFLSAVSHELRTPLATLRLHADALTRRLSDRRLDEEHLRRTIPRIAAQLDRLEGLVTSLLDVTTISGGTLQLHTLRFDLAQLAADAVERLEDDAERRGSKLVLRASPAVGRWDRARLDQVVTNLVDNALKFAPGRPVELEVGASDGHAVLAVRDFGPGISRESQALIFQQYERAAEARAFGGLGLGLWIARRIVEAHRGTISVESRPGSGSTFTVKLPLEEW